MSIDEQIYFNQYFETKVRMYHKQGFIKGPIYVSGGTEHIPVLIKALLHRDLQYKVFPQHRCHSWYLTFGGDIEHIIESLLGLAPQGSASLHIPNVMFGHDGLLGSNAPIACGYAYGTNKPVICHLGDAAVEEDYVLGAFGFAATHNLPILFVVEDNGLSILTETKHRRKWDVVEVAKSFGIHAVSTEDILSLKFEASPMLINIPCNRANWHEGSGKDVDVSLYPVQLDENQVTAIESYINEVWDDYITNNN